MNSQSVVANTGAIDQTALYHEPTQKTLQRPQPEQHQRLQYQFLGQTFSDQKYDEWNDEHHANGATDHPMQVFPKKDGFEICQLKMRIELLILWKLFVLLKRVIPICFVQGWNGSHDQAPVAHGKPRMCETRNATDQHHQRHHYGTACQPRNYPFFVFHAAKVISSVNPINYDLYHTTDHGK